MKKVIAMLLVLMCVMGAALAEGKLSAKDKTLIIFDDKDSGWFYARVENTGDAVTTTDSGDLVIFDEADEILVSESYVNSVPSYTAVAPGDYIYVREFLWDRALKDSTPADYKYSLGKRSRDRELPIQLENTVSFDIKDADSYDNYVYVTFTNTLDRPMYGTCVAAALYDEQDQLIFVGFDSLSALAIDPGSTVTLRMYVDNDHLKYYAKRGIVPARADAKVYIIEG